MQNDTQHGPAFAAALWFALWLSLGSIQVTAQEQKPYNGTPRQIPGRIQAEDYDEGGEGVAYHDQDTTNQGRQYRNDAVDIGANTDGGDGFHVGWFRDTEWLEYTVNVTEGRYDVNFRLTSPGTTVVLTLGENELGQLKVPSTHGWDNWQTVCLPNISLSAGQNQVLRLAVSGRYGVNLNWFEFVAAGQGQTTIPSGEGEFNVPQTADPAKITGARIDEMQVRETVWVDVEGAAASDDNPGTEARPLKTFAAGLERVKATLREGMPTKVVLRPGVYREGNFKIDGEEIGGKAKETLLIIEGGEKGRVIFSGSTTAGWEPDTWTLVDPEKRIYKHNWPYDWGPIATGWYKPEQVIGQRREMIFLNGQPLTQVLVEDWEWRRPQNEDFDRYGQKSIGPVAKSGRAAEGKAYIYRGYRGPNVLQPGEFGVAELGPGDTIQGVSYDGHPDPNTVFIRLPEGMANLQGALVEVSLAVDRPNQALWIRSKDNLVLRNLVFQHYGMECTRACLRTEEFRTYRHNRNWLLEDCEWRWNNGYGCSVSWVKGLTVRRCASKHNGGQGMQMLFNVNALIEDCDVSNNAWRNQMAQFHDHAVGGFDFMGMDMLIRRMTANDNGTGFGIRGDQVGINITFEDCQANGNHGLNGGGVFIEIMTGPFLFRNCQMIGNGRGLLVLNTYNVTMDHCTIANNEETQIAGVTMRDRRTPDHFCRFGNVPGAEFPIPGIKNLSLQHCIITTNRGPKSRLYSWSTGQPEAFYRNQLRLANNQYYNPDNAKVFDVSTPEAKNQLVDFEEWKARTGQEQGSSWAA